MKPPSRLTLPLVLLAVVPLFSSCLIGSHRHEEQSGTFIGDATFARVRACDSMEFVRELFGPPGQEIDNGTESSVIWKWSYKSETRGDGTLFLVFHTESSKSTDGTVFVEFEHGLVVKTWRDWNISD